jgi:hypothetical protein
VLDRLITNTGLEEAQPFLDGLPDPTKGESKPFFQKQRSRDKAKPKVNKN